jgi:hypothetical protein
MRRRFAPKATAAVLAVAIPLAAAGTAAADSIVYISDHDVWIANPDGSGARAITGDGESDWPYRSPSQANDGTIAAGRGSEVVRLDQQGNILSRFDPPVPAGTASFGASPPQDVAISPDGSKVAYTFYGYSCLPGASCGTRQMTVYSHSDRAEALGHEFSLTHPEWITNGSVLGFSGWGNQVNFDQPGSGDYDAKHWFDDGETDLTDGELSRQGDRLAVVRDYGTNAHLQLYAVNGFTAAPAKACRTGNDESLNDPSWSPDGKRIAFAHSEGVEVMALPSVVAGDCPGAQSGRVVLPGGSEPDWGPADVQPRYELEADVARGTRLAGALKRGLKLTTKTNVAGRLGGSILVDKKKVGAGTAELSAGPGSITFRFTKAARRKLASRRKVEVFVDATFTPRNGRPIPIGGSVEVKR